MLPKLTLRLQDPEAAYYIRDYDIVMGPLSPPSAVINKINFSNRLNRLIFRTFKNKANIISLQGLPYYV